MDIIAASQDMLELSRPLRDWLASGGIVIIPGLPVLEATMSVPASAILGKAVPGKAPVIKLFGRPNGRTLLASGAQPLIYEQRVGLGTVIHLAFNPSDPALMNKPGYDDLWREILQSACSGRSANSSNEYAAAWIEESSRQGMDIKPPKVPLVAGFLGGYILLVVPVNYFVLRGLRRKDLAWITIPVLVIIFSFAAYVAGSMSRGHKLIVKSSQVFEMPAGSVVARYHGNLSLFSPNRTRHTIQFPDPSALVSDTGYGGSAGAFPILQSVRTKKNLLLPDTDLFMWAVRTLAYQGIRRMPGTVSADLITDGTRIKGTITNNLTFPLKDCVLYGDRFEKEIAELPSGAKVSIDEPFRSVAKSVPQAPSDKYLQSFPLRTKFADVNPNRLTLSGRPEWADAPVPAEGTNVDMPLDMAFIHIYPRWVNGADGKVTGSVAGLAVDCFSTYASSLKSKTKGTRDVRLDRPVWVPPNANCSMQYQLPPFAELMGLSLYLGLSEPAVVYAQVYDHASGKWVDIGGVRSGSGKLPIPTPGRIIGRGGIVQIRLKRPHDEPSPVNVDARLEFQGRVK